MNKNPYERIGRQTKIEWLWEGSKKDIIFVTLFTWSLFIFTLVRDGFNWWVLLGFYAWYCLHILRWNHLYRKNLNLYKNWIKYFGK